MSEAQGEQYKPLGNCFGEDRLRGVSACFPLAYRNWAAFGKRLCDPDSLCHWCFCEELYQLK